MPINLLPASAQAFAPRSAPTIVLNSKVEQWLTQTLKRINKIKRPLNSVPQHYRCLNETLSGPNAIWSLCSLMLPKKPDADLIRDDNPLVEGMFNYELTHLEAYIVHVDMVSQHEVVFKLTKESIDALSQYHKDIYLVDVAANTYSWPEKETQIKKLQEDFIQAVNRFVFRTGVRALEGLEEDGAGELLDGRSEDVKLAIQGLFQPLLPPPPKIVDVMRPAPILPSSSNAYMWQSTATMAPVIPAPVDQWRVLSSTPSPTLAACTYEQQSGYYGTANCSMDVQLPSPAPSFSQLSQPFCTSESYISPTLTASSIATSMASIPLPLPSLLTQQCGSSAAQNGYGNFAWSFNEYATPMFASAV
jgi:hypothetical protein